MDALYTAAFKILGVLYICPFDTNNVQVATTQKNKTYSQTPLQSSVSLKTRNENKSELRISSPEISQK